MANSRSVERFVKRNGMSAGFARRFVAGEQLEDTIGPVHALNKLGITCSLDYLGENVTRAEEAVASAAYYLKLLRFIDDNQLGSNVSLKLTQLGLDVDEGLAEGNLRTILADAERYDQFVRIDMEGSEHTQRTLDLFYRLWDDHKNVGVVIQSYLYRSEADIERLVSTGVRVRLCKGAYNEPREVAYPHKAEVDENYRKLMRTLLTQGNYPALATHDPSIIEEAQAFVSAQAISLNSFEFQMLFGIRRDLQRSLAANGYRMRVYVPFGTQWYGYMMRRLAERPANLWFVLRNVLRR